MRPEKPISLLLALFCSTVHAQQLVSIDWKNKTTGEVVVSSTDNPTRLTDEQLKAQGYQKATYTDGSVYWFKQVMTCGSGTQTASECGSQATLHSGSS
jgi:hypothetical protein